MEEVTEIKNGQKKLVRRVRMPGYVLVRMDLTDESWGAVRHTPGVTGFVGNAHQPVPLSLDEVFTMLAPADLESPAAAGSAAGGASGKPKRGRGRRLRGRRVRHRHGRARSRPFPPRSPRSTPTPRSSRCSSRSSAGRPRSSCRSTRSPRSERTAAPVPGTPGACNRVIAHGVGPHQQKEHSNASQEQEDLRLHQAADPGRCGHARPARRPGPRPARRQHHGVRQGVQRCDGVPARQRHPRGDHGLRRPVLHLHHQDAAGRRADQEGRRVSPRAPASRTRPRSPSCRPTRSAPSPSRRWKT